MNDQHPALTTPDTSDLRCPGQFVRWSAFGASYPDTVCAHSLTWPDGEHPGSILCDADNDLRPGDVPCPAHDPEGFAEWADDPDAARRVLAREAGEAPLAAPPAPAPEDREALIRLGAQAAKDRGARNVAQVVVATVDAIIAARPAPAVSAEAADAALDALGLNAYMTPERIAAHHAALGIPAPAAEGREVEPPRKGNGPCNIPHPHEAHRWGDQDVTNLPWTCPGVAAEGREG